MLGTVPTSVPQFILLGNWLLEGKFSEKWLKLKTNKLFWILSSVFLIHLVGLLYTTDLKAGWDDVRTKIPLMYLPLIYFSTEPLKKKEFHYLLYSFIIGTFINVSWCFTYKIFIDHSEKIRNVSRFMSHIRLGFLIDLAIVFSIYYAVIIKKTVVKFLFLLLTAYFLYSLYALGLISGIANLAIIGIAFIFIFLFNHNKLLLIGFLSALSFITFYFLNRVHNFYESNFQVKSSPVNSNQLLSPSGQPYNNYQFIDQVENGYIVAKNFQETELEKVWNSRVKDDTFNLAQKHNRLRYFTLLRYITSKGELKDSVSVSKLSDQEIEMIKKGVTNMNYQSWSYLNKRLYELLYEYFEYKNNGTVNGHSFTMRLFYLKSAYHVIQNNLFFGVGTGDVQQAMNESYSNSASPLEKEWHKRPHNQFITITVALGLIGLMVFLVSLIFPIIYLHKELSFLYGIFISSAIISFLFEDTLETQIGLSFFAIFNTLFVSMAYFKKKQILQD